MGRFSGWGLVTSRQPPSQHTGMVLVRQVSIWFRMQAFERVVVVQVVSVRRQAPYAMTAGTETLASARFEHMNTHQNPKKKLEAVT